MLSLLAPVNARHRSKTAQGQSARIRRLTTAVVAGFALILSVPGQALAGPLPNPPPTAEKPSRSPTTGTKKNRKNGAMVDGKPGFVNVKAGAAATGGVVAQQKA